MAFLKHISLFLSLCLSVLCLTGCAGYRLGPTNDQLAGDVSVEVKQFKNLTIEPRLSAYLMTPLRRAIQQDGTFRLCTDRDSSDYILEGTITDFERNGIGSYPGNVSVHVDYYITISVHAILRERATGRVLLEQDFEGSTVFPLGKDQTSAERQAIPIAMENLARNIASVLGDGKIK